MTAFLSYSIALHLSDKDQILAIHDKLGGTHNVWKMESIEADPEYSQ